MAKLAFIGGLPGGPEVLLVLFVVLLLFGAKKLPELSRSIGRSLGEFKKGKEELEREIRGVKNDVMDPLEKMARAEVEEDDRPVDVQKES